MSVQIQIEQRLDIDVDLDWLEKVASRVLALEDTNLETELTVVITDDRGIQELNKRFRATDAPTDVLAFAAQEGDEMLVPEGLMPYLGDIVISYPTAATQALEEGHSTEKELALLVVHGILHLLGYDDEDATSRDGMWSRQAEILATLPDVPA